jgi:hypothetical protein
MQGLPWPYYRLCQEANQLPPDKINYLIVPSRLADASSAFIGISTGISSRTPSGGMAAVMAGFAFGQEHSY